MLHSKTYFIGILFYLSPLFFSILLILPSRKASSENDAQLLGALNTNIVLFYSLQIVKNADLPKSLLCFK